MGRGRHYKCDLTLDGKSESFFCSCTCVKVLFTNAFLKCRFRLKVEIISTFPLRTNVVKPVILAYSCKQSES